MKSNKVMATGFLYSFKPMTEDQMVVVMNETYPALTIYAYDDNLFRIYGALDKWEWKHLQDNVDYAIFVITVDFTEMYISGITGEEDWQEWAIGQLINDLGQHQLATYPPLLSDTLAVMKPQWNITTDTDGNRVYSRFPIQITVKLNWSDNDHFEARCSAIHLETGESTSQICDTNDRLLLEFEGMVNKLMRKETDEFHCLSCGKNFSVCECIPF